MAFLPPDADSEPRMTGVYVRVLVIEAIIIVALWALGRAFS